MIKKLILLFSLAVFTVNAQVNQTDANGKKHGKWQKVYEGKNKQLRYEGQFEHGTPVGTFSYYYENGGLKTTSVYRGKTGNCYAKMFSDKRQLEAEGLFLNRKKDSTWTFYGVQGQLISREDYIDGQLDGVVNIYYSDGRLAEKTVYVKDVKEGEQIQKFEDGKMKFKGTYVNNTLHGEATYYSQSGRPFYKGSYHYGLRHGRWLKIEDGKVILIETFYKGILRESKEN